MMSVVLGVRRQPTCWLAIFINKNEQYDGRNFPHATSLEVVIDIFNIIPA